MKGDLLLRKLLWIRHGCPPHALYGDDGEMQCSACTIDFLRDTPDRIEQRFMEINQPKIAKFFKEQKDVKHSKNARHSNTNPY